MQFTTCKNLWRFPTLTYVHICFIVAPTVGLTLELNILVCIKLFWIQCSY